MVRRIALSVAVSLTASVPVLACSLCGGGANRQTLRQEAAQAKLVLYGTLSNPRLNAPGTVAAGDGLTDLQIDHVLKRDPFLGQKKTVELPRYVPVNPKEPPKFLVFCDVYNGRLDPYRGLPVRSAAIVTYLQGALALDPNDRPQALLYFFNHLDDAEPEIAADAFLEFARASDREVGQVAAKLAPDKFRNLLQAPTTPPERIGLFGFLLGACGKDQDAALLLRLVQNPTAQTLQGLSGLLSGYVELRPREGWELAWRMLRDDKRPFEERLAALRLLRFYHGWKPEESRANVLRGLGYLLPQGDLADLAVEDLRRWRCWDLTADVLAQYGKKSHDAPIMRRAIVRYTLSCPRPEAARFLATVRRQEPELVRDVEESLQFEKEK
jgi:hypothetical protein